MKNNIYVWEVKYYWGEKRKKATDYSVHGMDGEFDTLEKAYNYKKEVLNLFTNDMITLEDKNDYFKIGLSTYDVSFTLKKVNKNHQYHWRLDNGAWA